MSSQKRINILQLVDGFRFGGAETKLLELIKKLDKNRYQVTVCSLTASGSLKDYFEKLDVKVKILNRKHKFDLTVFPKLVRFMRDERIQIVQTTLFYADVLGPIAARFAGVPGVISWETISHQHSFYKPEYRRLAYRFAMKFVDTIVAVSDDVKRSLITLNKIDPLRIQTIRYGVDLQRFNKNGSVNKRNELGLNSNNFVIGVVARLDEIKGHRYLIDALSVIKQKYPDTKCLFIGDGEYRKKLEDKCRLLGLSENVVFLGFRNDVSEIVPVLDLFVLPSISEGLPNVILEAMASSIAVVATSVGGIPEVITNDENGVLVPPKNSQALASAILELLDDKEKIRRLSSKGRNFVGKEFSLEKQVGQFQALYEQLIEKK